MKGISEMFRNKAKGALVALVTTAVVAATLVAGGTPAVADVLPGVAPIEQRNAQTVTADALPTVQIDSGIVWTQVMHGDVVYAGGSFSQTRPAGAAPGTNLTPRSNLLAYDVTTGNLLPFAPQINGTVKALALSPDGATLYVGGSFTKVGTTTRYNVAAFSTATGELSATFKPAIGGSYVNAIVPTSTVVYFGGLIGAAGGQPRTNFAAANVTGQVLGWAPTSDLQVDSMVLAPGGGKVIAAGRFARINGVTQRGLAALDLNDGSLLPWSITNIVKNGRNDGTRNSGQAGIWAVTADDENVYGTGWVFADVPTGNLEGLFAADGATGDEVWVADCHGDHYGVFSDGMNVYSTGHEHECTTAGGLPQGNGTMRNATIYTAEAKGTLTRSPYVNSIYADWSGHPAPAAVNWFPDWLTGTASGMGQAGWTVTGNDDFVVFGGEFVGVNNQRQQGLVRFARAPQSGAVQGPMLAGSTWSPTGRSLLGGTADVVIASNWDRDDRDLTYELWEEGATGPSASVIGASTFWNTPDITLRATGLEPDSVHTFRVRAKDGDGNTAVSGPVTVTVTSLAPSAYANEVLAAGPTTYWRFNQPDPKLDWAGSNDLVTRSGYSANSDSAISGESGSAAFNGSTQGFATTPRKVSATSEYSLELWFKAGQGTTGKLIGYGDSNSGNSGSYDRHIYLTSSGRLYFGTYPNEVKTVATPSGTSYADGQWHHVVATQGASGMALYVDGTLAATDPSTVSAQSYSGYWRIGGDTLSGWTEDPPNDYFAGRLDEVAVYAQALTAQQVVRHYSVGSGVQAPVADFTAAGGDLTWMFDGSTSTADGAASYHWDFGDGSPEATGVTATHTYAAAGTYTVALTVEDAHGLHDVKMVEVVASEPHQPPVAVIAEIGDGLTVTFDSAGSTATGEATIASVAWDFGDGETSDDPAPTHRYAQAGTYAVTLVVTDSTGSESEPVAVDVTVTHDDPVAVFDAQTSALTVSVDASGSTASDDATLTYAWNWGDDSGTGSGVSAEHTYAEPGQYEVTLTVTDSQGADATVAHSVEVTGFLAHDAFERSEPSGWGNADSGGAWSGAAGLSVADGVGKLTVNRSQTRTATLSGLDVADFDATVGLSIDKIADGGGVHINVMARKTAAGDYRTKLRISSAGTVTVNLAETVGAAETLIGAHTLSGFTLDPGTVLNVRFAVTEQGAAAAVKAKVWASTATEPEDWTVTALSSTAALQQSGSFAIGTYATGTVTNGPVVIAVDDLKIQGLEAAAHTAPIAVITSDPSGLDVAFSAAASQAHDGAAVASYAWNFGDGSTSTDAAPNHTYAEPGTYEVTLVVTDSVGTASTAATASVTVTPAAPVAEFTAHADGLAVDVDASASHASGSSTIASYEWEWGDGASSTGVTAEHTYGSAGSFTVTLTVTDSLGITATTTRPVLASEEQFLARDDFERTVGSGWGEAAVGGAWSGTTGLSVEDGVGVLSVGKSQTRTVTLMEPAIGDSDSTFAISLDRVADGGGVHFNYGTHRSSEGEYRAKLRISATGVVNVGVARLLGTTETLIANKALSGFAYTADTALGIRVQTESAGGTTTVRVKVWPAESAEPSAWTVTASDSEAALQAPGGLSISAYGTGTVTNGPVAIAVDDLAVR